MCALTQGFHRNLLHSRKRTCRKKKNICAVIRSVPPLASIQIRLRRQFLQRDYVRQLAIASKIICALSFFSAASPASRNFFYAPRAATRGALSFSRAASAAARGRQFCRRFSPTFVLAGYSRYQKIWRAGRAVIFSAASSADLSRLLNGRPPPINSFWQLPRCQEIRRARCLFRPL